MAGIYFHIPFCKQACHYCDFHFVTSLKYRQDMLAAMEKELRYRQKTQFFVPGTSLESIYFGGGTPSILDPSEIGRLLSLCSKLFDTGRLKEVTLEANPDDLTTEKIRDFRDAGINRLSIGVQSFFEEDLRWMNRAHGAGEAERAIRLAQDAGLENITADLIYGYPLLTDKKWDNNIETMTGLGVPHVSAYSMTVEPRTALGTWVRKGQEPSMDEEQSARQFERLMEKLAEKGYEHYEISNWAQPGKEAIHNGNYWKGQPYLGIGPSAHSFDGQFTRYWNVANNAKYMQGMKEAEPKVTEKEVLNATDRFNEYVMTALRTSWGLDLARVRSQFGPAREQELGKGIQRYIVQHLIQPKPGEQEIFVLTDAGKLLADRIASDLFCA